MKNDGVVKTQRQSGNFAPSIGDRITEGKFETRKAFLWAGTRFSEINVRERIVYETVHTHLSGFFEVQRKDLLLLWFWNFAFGQRLEQLLILSLIELFFNTNVV